MRVAIAGAGAVGRSIAQELVHNGHEVLLIERKASAMRTAEVPDAEWVQADACELAELEDAELSRCDVVIAATGDDKVNLVVSLLARTVFAVPRVVARVNDPRNEELFDESWGVDVSVSSPRVLAALVEEAVTVGDLVRLMTFRHGQANLVEVTLAKGTPYVGKTVGDLTLPRDAVLVTVLRGKRVIVPSPDEPLEAADELIFVASEEVEDELQTILTPTRPEGKKTPPN
ncbi:MAG: potassium channel family protein [Geodermatophilaceae bacterium]